MCSSLNIYIKDFLFFPKKYLFTNFMGFLLKKQEIKNKKFNGKSKIDKGNINRNNKLKWNETQRTELTRSKLRGLS